MDKLHRTANQRVRQVLQESEKANQERIGRGERTLPSTNTTVSASQRPVRTIARQIRQNARGYRSYLVIAREQAGITSISDFDQLNPYLLDAMIEGYERQQLNQRVEWSNMLQQVPFMTQWINLDNGALSQINAAIQQTIDQKLDQIDKAHRDMLLDVDNAEVQQADAFAKVFDIKKKRQEGG